MYIYLIGSPFISESLTEVTSLCITVERCNAFFLLFHLEVILHFSACAISIDVVMLKIWLSLTSVLPCLLQQLLFEASEGGKTDNLRKLVSKCQEIGVSLNELLNLSSYKTESKNH